MKIKPCPFCPEKMYIYMKQERWVCADHAQCGYTLDATPDEIAAAVNVYSKRVRREVTAQTGNVAPAVEI